MRYNMKEYLTDDNKSAAKNFIISSIEKIGKVKSLECDDEYISVIFRINGEDKDKVITKKIDDLFISPDMRDMYMRYDILQAEEV